MPEIRHFFFYLNLFYFKFGGHSGGSVDNYFVVSFSTILYI
nr:MAG TPA: hypothetical protein [Caudoviricetes sp.]